MLVRNGGDFLVARNGGRTVASVIYGDIGDGIALCASTGFSHAGGRVHIGGHLIFHAEHDPSVFRIVNENISVALNVFNLVVTRHFPGVDRVDRHPLHEGWKVVDDFCAVVGAVDGTGGIDTGSRELGGNVGGIGGIKVRLTPADIDVKKNTCNIALDIVIDFHDTGFGVAGIGEDAYAVKRAVGAVCDIAEGTVGLDAVDIAIGGTEVMQVCAAGAGSFYEICLTFTPDVLAFHSGAAITFCVLYICHQLVAIEQQIVAAAVDSIGIVPVIGKGTGTGSGINNALIGVCVNHQLLQCGINRIVLRDRPTVGRVDASHTGDGFVVIRAFGVVCLSLRGKRSTGNVARGSVPSECSCCGTDHREGQ